MDFEGQHQSERAPSRSARRSIASMEALPPHRPDAIDQGPAAPGWGERELNHRVANSLQLAVNFLGFQQQRAGEGPAREALEEAMSRLVAVGQLHRYLAARDSAAPVELAGFLRGLCAVVGLSTGLACELHAEPVGVPAHLAQYVGLLVNECAINARKHAYGRDGGVLRIACAAHAGQLRVVVADEGRGLGAAARPDGLGMSIVSAIVRELGGAMAAETAGGARFTFVLPLAAAPPGERSFASWSAA
jgi:two-component sensor histidine kinase